MNKLFLIFAGVAGAAAVLLGALLSHQLKSMMPERALEVFDTGVRYQFYHVFALLATGILSERFHGSWINRAGSCFIAGILLFSGSLYIISILIAASEKVPLILGILTPLGGVAFISGWIFLTISAIRGRSS
jgi:uncharacterized membrane protein YgdD (TMEM256/DUF423 family)